METIQLTLEEIQALSDVPDNPLSRQLAGQIKRHALCDERSPDYPSVVIAMEETSLALREVMMGAPPTPRLRRNPRHDRRPDAIKDRIEKQIDLFRDLVARYSVGTSSTAA